MFLKIYEKRIGKIMHPNVRVDELDKWLEKKGFINQYTSFEISDGTIVNPPDIISIEDPNRGFINGEKEIPSYEYYAKERKGSINGILVDNYIFDVIKGENLDCSEGKIQTIKVYLIGKGVYSKEDYSPISKFF